MGNKLTSTAKIPIESPDEIYVLLQINNPSGIISEHLQSDSLQQSNAGTFRYYNVGNKSSDMINNDYSFTLMIYKGQSQTDKRVFIDARYRYDKIDYPQNENVILKKRFYDVTPTKDPYIILRHCDKMNLKQIIVKGAVFNPYRS
jgi:hypothetical protein